MVSQLPARGQATPPVAQDGVQDKEARRRALKIEAELPDGRWKAAAEPVMVADAVAAYEAFLRSEDRAPKTLAKYATVFARVASLAAERRLRELSGIDLSFVDAYRQMRAEAGATPKTRYTETVVIRQLVNFALARDLIPADPLMGLKLKKPNPTPQPCWTRAKVETILVASPPDVRPAFTLMAETGMRFGELAWLTREDVDLPANALRAQPKAGVEAEVRGRAGGPDRLGGRCGLNRAVPGEPGGW